MKNTRRQFIQTIAAGVGAGSLPAHSAERKPNVLFIHVDQHRGMDCGYAGSQQVKTPNLDRLAREGVAFSNGIANSPLCTPSRAIMLSGKYPLKTGCVSNDLRMNTGQATIATELNQQGYQCGYIGKWHLDGVPRSGFTPPGPRRQGFDNYWAVYNCHHNYMKPKYYLDTPELIQKEGYEPFHQTDLAADFIRKHQQSPYCLLVSYGPPHSPYQMVPEPYKSMYDPETITPRKNSQNPKMKDVAGYYAHITALDDCVGRLLKTLEATGQRRNTIVVFTSDHGDMLWSHGRTKKQQPWEESINVPLIFSQPGRIPSGQPTDDLFGTADLTPTLLALTGTPVPSVMEGMDLSQRLLTGKGQAYESVPIMDIIPADQAKQWGGRTWRGVRTKRYTYARWTDKGWVLFDNQKDPYQVNNLIDDPSAKALQKEMEAELQKWLKRMDDPFLTVDGMLEVTGLADDWKERNDHFARGRNW